MRDAGRDGARPVQHTSGGISVAWGADLRTPGDESFFAAIVGLRDVEHLTLVGDEWVATALPRLEGDASCSHTVPVALALVDADQDGSMELLVHDLCGAYLVHAATSERARVDSANDWLPGDGPYKYVETSAAVGGYTELATGSEKGFSILRSAERGARWTPVGSVGVPQPGSLSPKHGIVPVADSHVWFAVGETRLFAFEYTGSSLQTTEYVPEPPEPPNLIPYSTIDDLQLYDSPSCGRIGFGIGRFPATAGRSPSAPILVQVRSGEHSYRTTPLALDVDALALALERLDAGSFLVGVLGRRAGQGVFDTYRVGACGEIELLATAATTISDRRAPAPGFGEARPVTSEHVRLLALHVAGARGFVTYDGYDARTYMLADLAPHRVEERTFHVHSDRADLAFP